MKAWMLAFAWFFCAQFMGLEARAQVYYPPVVYYDVFQGAHFGWGWYPVWSGAAYGPNSVVVGYAYGPNYNYYPYPRKLLFSGIAYSAEADKVGLSWGYTSQEQALEASIANCGDESCKGVIWVQGGCAAVAKGEGSAQVAWAYHQTLFYAKAHAMRSCKQSRAENCVMRGWTCSF